MIDSNEVVRVFFEEALLFAERDLNRDFGATSAERFAECTRLTPLPSQAILSAVVREVFWASLMTEEGRACHLRVAYVSGDLDPARQLAFALQDPLEFDRQELRRLAHAHDHQRGDVLWSEIDQVPKIIGIRVPTGGDSPGLRIRATGPGELDVAWFLHRLLALKNGRLVRYSTSEQQTWSRALGITEALFGLVDPSLLHDVLRVLVEQHHGGSVWMISESSELNKVSVGYPICRHEPIFERVAAYENRLPWLRGIGHLAGIDGAIVVDSRLRLVGFGAFVDLSGELAALRVHPDGRTKRLQKAEIGGGRHRSAVAFCAQNAPAAACVVSQDGRLSVVTATSRAELPRLVEVVALDMVDRTIT